MNTSTAANQAGVTAATIRTWCRIGAIAATKTGRRWIIEAASLARRIAIGAKKTAKQVVFSIDTMTAIGGSRWTKAGKDRVYIDWATFAGLEISHYNSGNIASATYQGREISNSQAYKLGGSIDKVWFDAATGQLHCRYGHSESRVATRQQVWADIITGVRAAIAAI